ncbi:hypothetical protein PL263_17450 [Methylomonas sp. EFPC3]|uniref:hypothetical protein n=1 Tax=Methylomonas sp. EFPC3 TaxID=3021710 RepID=UPI00241620D1|nr:hypothetical protein [Methylomonas sp. EFPC3]WFP49873.1 hypothetical protein PL263_17450 [Methylomonas sp. EFPC3]
MKGAEIILLMQIAVTLILWVFTIVSAVFFTRRSKRSVKILFVTLALLSVPSYMRFYAWYLKCLENKNNAIRLEVESQSSHTFKNICDQQHDVTLMKVVYDSKPIDIEVIDEGGTWGLNLLEPRYPETRVCWLEEDFSNCPHSNIGSVEWTLKMPDYFCAGLKSSANCERHYLRNNRKDNKIIEIDRIHAQYGLFVSKAESIAPFISRYRIFIKDTKNKNILAETFIYLKLRGYVYQEKNEPLYCPPRDVHIAKMLREVFPISR